MRQVCHSGPADQRDENDPTDSASCSASSVDNLSDRAKQESME